jgi:hypothetical protein
LLSWIKKDPDDNQSNERQLERYASFSTLFYPTHNLTTGLIGHLRNNFKAMHQLWLILHERDGPATEDEIAVASGRKDLDPDTAAEYLRILQERSEGIKAAFEKRQAQAAV